MPGQLKKLFYNKTFTDSPDGGSLAKWKMSPVKIIVLSIALAILSIILYAYFFTKDPQNFLGNMMFYAVVLIIAVLVLWIVGNKAWTLKNRIAYFLLTFIILWVAYFAMSLIFGYLGMKFYIGGYALWSIIAVLSFWGSSGFLFDKEINRKDFIYLGVVAVVFLGANITMNSTGGFLANFDKLLTTIFSFIKL